MKEQIQELTRPVLDQFRDSYKDLSLYRVIVFMVVNKGWYGFYLSLYWFLGVKKFDAVQSWLKTQKCSSSHQNSGISFRKNRSDGDVLTKFRLG